MIVEWAVTISLMLTVLHALTALCECMLLCEAAMQTLFSSLFHLCYGVYFGCSHQNSCCQQSTTSSRQLQ